VKKVLVVDDEPSSCSAFPTSSSNDEVNVIRAEMRTRRSLGALAFDLVIADIRLSGMDA